VIQFEDGELITTDLWNRPPFIRYRNGDAGSWIEGACPCRRHAPRFTISGRAQDLIVTPTRIISPTTLSQVLLHEGLDAARVVQHARRSIEILLVANERFTEEDFASTKEELLRLLHGTKVSFSAGRGDRARPQRDHRVSVNRSGASPDDVAPVSDPERIDEVPPSPGG
jgi:phenylacetate-coenzyme A ligase PaaK-like adenylate-forming protein